MPSERVQRQIDLLLDEIDAARTNDDWKLVRRKAEEILDLHPENEDALAFLAASHRRTQRLGASELADSESGAGTAAQSETQPTSFASGRYEVKRFLGEGGKKKVYLAHDTTLDRDVAFALIKTDGLDDVGRQRIENEARAMGRLGDHPQIVTIYDVGEEQGQPFMVLPLMPGGDVEGLIEKAPEHRLPIADVLRVGGEVCAGLEFAHERGIVHRDLKPGNVWLTADGRAKIGDFGLAVAADRSRLTQAGMMVGTVSYMPPEQAMGGEVGARSDLYSLGAMLYEMVCGRPPFLGDESVAIIGQHLNTPPVAPSWHRPECPRGLEALILRLLEKDPARRPSSATEAGATLAGVSTGSVEASAVQPQTNDPLYRRTFVGREPELKQLHEAFDAALSGHGSLAMVVGEPGIGKTALCEQLSTYVALRGGRTLVGHCYEEGSLSLPYLPFVEAMRSYVLAREPEGLEADLGSGAADVARIVSEIRDRLQVELRVAGDPQDDRFRLLQATSSFLATASSVQPLLIVLEDLHWADLGTLELLQHLARTIEGARLLVVGTYRDVEVDRSHPLSGALAELRRSSSFLRLPLRGLTVDEVHRMYEQLRGNDVPWSQAELVYRQTEGNPLFVQEVLRYLVEEGLVVREGDRYVPRDATSTTIAIPEGLRDVIGKRLSHLNSETNQLLSIASVIGRDFELETLRRVSELPEEPLIAAIEQALSVAVLEDQSRPASIRYRFAHAFFREALYEELSAPRRLRQHQQIARALEAQFAGRLEEHAPELAEHFSHSTDRDDLAKAVSYCELAATRAMGVYAYGEAARLLLQALEVQEVLDPDDQAKRCDLLVELGQALHSAGEPRRVLEEVAPAALALAEALDDRERASHVCQLAIAAIHSLGGGAAWATSEAAYWTNQADRFAAEGSVARVWADYALAMWGASSGELRTALEAATRAREGAHRLGDPVLQWAADTSWLYVAFQALPTTPASAAERLALAEDILVRPRVGAGAQVLELALTFMTAVFLQSGLRERAEAGMQLLEAHVGQTKTLHGEFISLACSSWPATADGRLEEAVAIDQRLLTLGEETGLIELSSFLRAVFPTSRARLYLGVNEVLDIVLPAYDPFVQALAQVQLGREEVGLLLEQVMGSSLADPNAEATILSCVVTGELAVLARDKAAARLARERLQSTSLVTSGVIVGPVCIARLLGDLSALLGDQDEARAYYDQAFRICDEMRLRPEKALSALGMAELLLLSEKGERVEALPHLDFAIAEFQEMKMQPSLERALGHRGLLRA